MIVVSTWVLGLVACGGGSGAGSGSGGLSALVDAAVARVVPAAATVATFTASRSSYAITKTSAGYNVRHNGTGANTLVAPGISLKFSDVTVNTGMGEVSNSISPENLRTLTELYVAFFNRMPDAEGLSYWVSQFNAGQSIEQIAGAFYSAALQFSSTTGYTAAMTNADFVKIVYKNVLGRSGTLAPPDADVQYWANQLATGAASRGTLVNTMLSAAHGYANDATWNWVASLLDNKAAVANYLAVQQGLGYNTPEESISKTAAIAALVTQTGTTAAVNLVGVSDSGFNLAGCVCLQGVSSGFKGDIETVAANVGSFNLDAGGSGGAGGGDGGSGAGGGLGKVLGGLMRVTDLSNGVVVGQATTDLVNGMVTIRTGNRPGPFLLTLEGRAGAKYFDEGLNQLTDFGPGTVLNALVDKWDEHVGVSPLTEAAYRYALNNFMQDPARIASGAAPLLASGSLVGLSADQVRTANRIVLNEVNARTTDKFQMTSVKALPTPIAQSAGAVLTTSRYGLSAAVNGGIVQAANYYNPANAAPALSVANDLARDLTDGRINGFALDGSQVAPSSQVTYDSVRLPVGGMVGTNAVTQRFGAVALTSSPLTMDEEGSVYSIGTELQYQDDSNVSCAGFRDDVALLSDATVTVSRRFPTNAAGKCSFIYSAAENARVVITKRFLTNVKQISRSGNVGFAVKTDGSVVGWGDNYCGRLSPALPAGIYYTPQVVAGLKDITSISVDWANVMARDKSGSVFTWAFAGGQTATRSVLCGVWSTPSGVPYNQYRDSAIVKAGNLQNIAMVFAVSSNYFALSTDGQLYGWGEGLRGLLANSDGTVIDGLLRGPVVDVPTPIAGLSKVRQIAFTKATAFALLADGTVKAWGMDELKLLGRGVSRQTLRPTTVDGLTNISVLVASPDVGVRMIKFDGTVLAWGNMALASFSNVTYPPMYVPTVIAPFEKIRYISDRSYDYTVLFSSGRLGRDIADIYDRFVTYK